MTTKEFLISLKKGALINSIHALVNDSTVKHNLSKLLSEDKIEEFDIAIDGLCKKWIDAETFQAYYTIKLHWIKLKAATK